VRLAQAPESASPERRYLCLQSRRVARLTPAKLEEAVTDFLAGKWAPACRVFVYATSLSAVRSELGDEIRVQTSRLLGEGIEFEVWDAELMSPWLKEKPSLVYDFFGRSWAKRFCGRKAVGLLGTRLDAQQVGELRDRMQRFYTALFDVTDSGMAGLRRAGAPRLAVRDRFVIPDVMVTKPAVPEKIADPGAAAGTPRPVHASPRSDAPAARAWYQHAQSARYTSALLPSAGLTKIADDAEPQAGGLRLPFAGAAAPVRTDPDTWLASGDRHVLVGDPGSGKTTFLRYLVLDTLSDSPVLAQWARRLGGRLPVWLPFHFYTARWARSGDGDASLAATLRAWLEQYDAADLWPLVEVALQDQRLLLIIDGLDEWVSESAGHSALVGLDSFLGTRKVPALVSARPYGLDRMPLAGEWDYASMADLSAAQQRRLAGLWFGTGRDDTESDAGPRPQPPELEDFMAEVEGKAELRRLAATPLFLLLLVGLRLSGVPLPDRRLDVAAWLQDDPVGTVPDQQDLGPADQQRAGRHVHREAPPRGKIPTPRQQPHGLRQQHRLFRGNAPGNSRARPRCPGYRSPFSAPAPWLAMSAARLRPSAARSGAGAPAACAWLASQASRSRRCSSGRPGGFSRCVSRIRRAARPPGAYLSPVSAGAVMPGLPGEGECRGGPCHLDGLRRGARIGGDAGGGDDGLGGTLTVPFGEEAACGLGELGAAGPAGVDAEFAGALVDWAGDDPGEGAALVEAGAGLNQGMAGSASRFRGRPG
jgi:hypothetical protein